MKRDYSYLIGNQFAKGIGPSRTSFKKGHIPWNKGIKRIHLSPEQRNLSFGEYYEFTKK